MADPLSVSASIIGFVGFAGKIISILSNYVGSVKSAPQEARTLCAEIESIQDVLNRLDDFLCTGGDEIKATFADGCVLESAITECRGLLMELYKKIGRLSQAKNLPGGKDLSILERLKCLLRKDEYEKAVTSLQRFVKIFEFSLNISNWYDS